MSSGSERVVVGLSECTQSVSDGLKASMAHVEAWAASSETSESGFILQVKKKLKQASPEIEEIDVCASLLTDADQLYQKFFSRLCSQVEKSVEEALEDNTVDLASPQEMEKFRERQRRRIGRVVLPITLYLQEIDNPIEEVGLSFTCFLCKLVGAKYGPVHAAVKVGNVILEWNQSSLVSPHFETPVDVVFRADMRRGSDTFQKTAGILHSANKPLCTQSELNHLCDSQDDQQTQLKELSKLIATYNRKYYYNPVSRNCQTFVSDVLKVFKIDDPLGQLAEVHIKQICDGSYVVPNSFKTHEDLDRYIEDLQNQDLLGCLNQDNIEVLTQVYLHLHGGSTVCQHATCKMKDLQKIYDAKLENLDFGKPGR